MNSFFSHLKASPFFCVFEDHDIEEIAKASKVVSYQKEDVIFREGEKAEAFYILLSGTVRLAFDNHVTEDHAESEQIIVRNINEIGKPVGWSSVVPPYIYRATTSALSEVTLLSIKCSFLRKYCEKNPDFNTRFIEEILSLLGSQLNATRLTFISRLFEQEVAAIRSLLEQSKPSLTVHSPLHKIPIYLENRLTLPDAFQCLEELQQNGSEIEKNLSNLFLEILETAKKELIVYQSLQDIYELAASDQGALSPAEIRHQTNIAFQEMFNQTDFIIKGKRNLPEQPGHIFVMNHLYNHPEYFLPNEFQLNFDVNFVSSMILHPYYKKGPLRVIRKSFEHEYAHQKYYDKLGYISVFSGHVDEKKRASKRSKEKIRQEFLEVARKHLEAGENISICPEGNCGPTERSPMSFKPGAFRLAQYYDPEPLIVPIAIAHFDKRISTQKTAAIIKRPFYLSDHLPRNSKSDAELFRFINAFQRKFRRWVKEAVKLSKEKISDQRKVI